MILLEELVTSGCGCGYPSLSICSADLFGVDLLRQGADILQLWYIKPNISTKYHGRDVLVAKIADLESSKVFL